MIDEKIINELREYLKDNYIPDIANPCCFSDSVNYSIRKSSPRAKASLVVDEIECREIDEKVSLRNISDEASKFIKEHRKPGGFAHALEKKRTEKGLSPSELYKQANIDRRQYSRFMGPEGRHPSMSTAISFALALELSRIEFDEFLQTAGYALSAASSRDVCIMYCLEKGIFDINDVNTLLFAIGLEPLSRE